MAFYLPFHWSLFSQIINFVNLPKFTQMPNWWRHKGTKFWFPQKMTFIFGFLDEKSIKMPSGYLVYWLRRILSSIEFSQLYRDCIGKLSFCPGWRHQRYSCKTLTGSRFRKNEYFLMRFFCSSLFLKLYQNIILSEKPFLPVYFPFNFPKTMITNDAV